MTDRDDRTQDEQDEDVRDKANERIHAEPEGTGARRGVTKHSQHNPDDVRDEGGPLEGRAGASGQGRPGQQSEDTEL